MYPAKPVEIKKLDAEGSISVLPDHDVSVTEYPKYDEDEKEPLLEWDGIKKMNENDVSTKPHYGDKSGKYTVIISNCTII